MSCRNGDWICDSCQHVNFKKRDSCQKCAFPRFGGEGATDISSYGIKRADEILPGDWYCNVITCGAHNYASRPNCFRCGASKSNGFGDGVMTDSAAQAFNGSLPGWKNGDWICTRVFINMDAFWIWQGLDVVHTTMLAGWSASN
ncbi:hypothetical protein U1Q18_041177, partial [Sarracenia purpurea var. burkii]